MNLDLRFHGAPPTHLTLPALARLGLRHASTTRHCPGLGPSENPRSPIGPEAIALLTGQGLDPGRVAFLQQVHGAEVRCVDGALAGCAGEGDVLLTAIPNLPLAIFTADCLAVGLFDPVGWRLAMGHVGWRGTVKSALPAAVSALVSVGARPQDLIAVIFPSIGPCCYEVDRPVIEQLSAAFPERWEEWVKPASPGKWWLDLWTANETQLRDLGVQHERVVNLRLCTRCRADLFFSYRREGGGGRLMTVAALADRRPPSVIQSRG